jgi:hypothetical protein
MRNRKIILTLSLAVILSFALFANTIAFAVDGYINNHAQNDEAEQILIEPTAVVPIAPLSNAWSVNFTGAFSPGAVPARRARLTAQRASDWKQLTFHGRTFFNTSQLTITIDGPLPGGPLENTRPVHAYCYVESNRFNARPANLYFWDVNTNYM